MKVQLNFNLNPYLFTMGAGERANLLLEEEEGKKKKKKGCKTVMLSSQKILKLVISGPS